MKITYRFIDGTETIVEVADENLAKIILDMNRQEESSQRKVRYYERSLDFFDELGVQLGTCDSYDIEVDIQEEIEKKKRVKEALSHLSEKQLRRLKLYADGKTYREIANIENTTPSVIFESISSAKKKFLKFFLIFSAKHPNKIAIFLRIVKGLFLKPSKFDN